MFSKQQTLNQLANSLAGFFVFNFKNWTQTEGFRGRIPNVFSVFIFKLLV